MERELLAAWANGDREAVERLLQDEHLEVDVDYQGYFSKSDSPDDTLLLCAVKCGELGIVKLLLGRGADVNLENERLETPLQAAIEHSHWEIVKTLLDHKDVDVCTFDQKNARSPLHLAVESGRVDIVRLILAKDLSGINDVDKWQQTPLDLAFNLKAGGSSLVHKLLKHGATTCGKPPLSAAVALNRVDLARQVLRMGFVDVNEAVNEADSNGLTPLHYAAHARSYLAVNLLLVKNADPNRRDKDTLTPLHRAVYTDWWVDEGDWDWTLAPELNTVKGLLESGVIDVNAVTETGWSALHYAVDVAWLDCVDLLLQRGAKADIKDESGRTPLFVAISATHPEADPVPCVRRLIDAGADVNVVTKDGETALHYAIKTYHGRTASDLVELLVGRGKANMNCVTQGNVDPLRTAIKKGNDEVVELLLQYGADHSLSRPSALAVVISTAKFPAECFVAMARSLCARGAKWDESCDTTTKHDADWSSGMRASVEHWARQFNRGVDSLTGIPFKTIKRGAKSVQASLGMGDSEESYLERVAETPKEDLLRRCKICVVGPTEWGKTTLVKALTTGEKASVDSGENGRTVGIDLQSLKFTLKDQRHEATLWDFAGQDEYQGAHSLFFSPKSLYLLCVDLSKYHDALEKFVDNNHAMEGFMRDNILRWVRAVTARHQDAKFVAVGTKLDQVKENEVDAIWNDLEHRWRKWTQCQDLPVKLEGKIAVNNKDTESVLRAVEAIKPMINASGVDLPGDHVSVLEWIRSKRIGAEADGDDERVGSVMWGPARLQQELNLGKVDDILALLHDLGDVYWHKSDRQDTIVIDPSLLLEFVKEIITHNCGKDADETAKKDLEEGRVCHKTLSKFPRWESLDKELTYNLKCLLQQLLLAYPDKNKEMAWNSDLIVPAYWKRNDRKPSKGLLRERSVMERHGVAPTFGYWLVYKVPPELSDIVLEQFAVKHRTYDKRKISRNEIEDIIDGDVVATVTLERDDLSTMDKSQADSQEVDSEHSTILDTIHLQVAGSITADEYLLIIVDAMEKVLGGFKGVGVSRFVKEKGPTYEKDHDWDDLVKKVELHGAKFCSSRAWMPPNFEAFRAEPHERKLLRNLLRMEGKVDVVLVDLQKLSANHEVLENLLRTTESEKRYPTQWKLIYDKNERKVELHIFCDLKPCRHGAKIITISAPREFLAKNKPFFKVCAWLLNGSKKLMPLGILDELVEKLVSDFNATIETAEKIRETVGLLDLSEGGEALVGEKLSKPEAAFLLHELLTICDSSFKVEKLPALSGLIPFANTEGKHVWVHKSELDPVVCVPKESGSHNASPSGVSEDPSASASSDDESEAGDEPQQQPDEEDDPSSDASSVPRKEAKRPFKAQLRILGITDLGPWNEPDVFLDWKLQDTSGLVFCSGTTSRHSDKTRAPSWENSYFVLSNIASLKQLAECNLRVEVKRPSSKFWVDTKTLYTGSKFLATEVGNLEDDASSRVLDIELTKKKEKTISVKCELAFA